MSPKPDVSEERKQQIYQAALTCFSRKGYHLTTMDDIVEEVGLSKGALYWYFESKKALFLALIEEMMGEMGQTWRVMVQSEENSATEKLLSSMAFFRAELEEMLPFFSIMMEVWSQTRHDEDVQKLTRQLYDDYLRIMGKILEEGAASGEFAPDLPAAMPLVIMTLYDGVALAIGTGLAARSWGEMMDAVESLVMYGLRRSPDAPLNAL